MGSFSWLKADGLTKISNIVQDAGFKFLIPIEFGGGYIKDFYQDYGYLGAKADSSPKYDMYELLAFWNKDAKDKDGNSIVSQLKYDGEFPKMKEIDQYTYENRLLGISIGCYDKDIDKLKYPLKLVSPSCKLTYEDIDKPSYGDPNQGFNKRYR